MSKYPLEFKFEPKSDITPYELAVILDKIPLHSGLSRVVVSEENEKDGGWQTIKRHFVNRSVSYGEDED